MCEKDNVHNDYPSQLSMMNNLNAFGMASLGNMMAWGGNARAFQNMAHYNFLSPKVEDTKVINARIYARGVRFRNPHMQVRRLDLVNKE